MASFVYFVRISALTFRCTIFPTNILVLPDSALSLDLVYGAPSTRHTALRQRVRRRDLSHVQNFDSSFVMEHARNQDCKFSKLPTSFTMYFLRRNEHTKKRNVTSLTERNKT